MYFLSNYTVATLVCYSTKHSPTSFGTVIHTLVPWCTCSMLIIPFELLIGEVAVMT